MKYKSELVEHKLEYSMFIENESWRQGVLYMDGLAISHLTLHCRPIEFHSSTEKNDINKQIPLLHCTQSKKERKEIY